MSEDAAAEDAANAARERLDRLFTAFDRLTPDELGRIGYRPASDDEREELLASVDEAAIRTGRVGLVDEARAVARESVLRRYSEGSLHPTWLALNWGLSQGTVEDRVAIVETLSDAAAAAVVEDVLDPEVAAALALDAEDVLGLAAGFSSEGSLARALAGPADPELGARTAMRRARLAFAVAVVAASVFFLVAQLDTTAGLVAAVVAAVVVVTLNARASASAALPEPRGRERGEP